MTLNKFLNARGKITELAEHLGVSVSLVSMWKSGKRKVHLKYCLSIHKWTNKVVSMSELRPDFSYFTGRKYRKHGG